MEDTPLDPLDHLDIQDMVPLIVQVVVPRQTSIHHTHQEGIHLDQVDLQVVHQMDLLHHLHQVLMKCTTTDLAGLNQVMEVLVLHIQVKTHQIMVLLQEHLLGHLQALLQEVLLQCRALIQAQHLADHQHKANLLILANHHTQINSR